MTLQLRGGNTFVLLQGFGWTIYGFICLLVVSDVLSLHFLCPLFSFCQFKFLSLAADGKPGLFLGLSVCGLIAELLLLASLNTYKTAKTKAQAPEQKSQQSQPTAASRTADPAEAGGLSGAPLALVRLANFLVCQNGLAHMFECPLTWWRPPRNFDLAHSLTYMFDPVSQWIALALLYPHLKHTPSGRRALLGLAAVGSGHVLSIWGQHLSFGGVTATHGWNIFYTLMDTVNLLHAGYVVAEHRLLGAADIAATYMLALASFFLLVHLDFVDFLTLLTSMQAAPPAPELGGAGAAGMVGVGAA